MPSFHEETAIGRFLRGMVQLWLPRLQSTVRKYTLPLPSAIPITGNLRFYANQAICACVSRADGGVFSPWVNASYSIKK